MNSNGLNLTQMLQNFLKQNNGQNLQQNSEGQGSAGGGIATSNQNHNNSKEDLGKGASHSGTGDDEMQNEEKNNKNGAGGTQQPGNQSLMAGSHGNLGAQGSLQN